jgi:hypothetical protein
MFCVCVVRKTTPRGQHCLRIVLFLTGVVCKVVAHNIKEITPLQYYGLGVYEDANGRGRHGHSWSPCLFEVLV